MSQKKTVAVSFAWKEEKDGNYRGLVDAFCDECVAKGIHVTRDALWLKHGDDLSRFMREEVGKAGVVVLFLSEAYIRSHNCMYEYLVAWNHDFDDADALASRLVLVSLLPAEMSQETGQWTWAIDYWTQLAKEQSELRARYSADLSREAACLTQHIAEIKLKVSAMLSFTNGRLGIHRPTNAALIVTEVLRRLGIDPNFAGSDEDIFGVLINEMNRILKKNERSRELLRKVAPYLLCENRLAEGVIGQLAGNDARKSPLLKIYDDLCEKLEETPIESSGDKEALKELTGGLLSLTISPQWIQKSRFAWGDSHTVKLPVRDSQISLGRGIDEGERLVDLLPLFCAVLTQGCARLDELFAPAQAYPRKLAPLASVSEGLSPDQVRDSIKFQLIQQIAPTKWKNPDPPLTSDTERRRDFESAFEETLELLLWAKDEERAPWVAADSTWAKQIANVYKELRASGLLMIDGKDGELRTVFPHSTEKLLRLRKVWKGLSGG